MHTFTKATDSSSEVQCCVTVKCSHPAEKFHCMNTYKRGCHGWFLGGFCAEESPDVKCCVDNSYDPNFRYASNEAAPSDWMVGLGLEPDGKDGGVATAPTGPPTTTKNPIKKNGNGSFDSNFGTSGGYARSNPGDGIMNNNGQCECKSFEKSFG